MPITQLVLLAVAADEKPDLKTGVVLSEPKRCVRDLGRQLTRRADDEATRVFARHSPHCAFNSVTIVRLTGLHRRFLSVLLELADASFDGRNEETKGLAGSSSGPDKQVARPV